MSGALWDPGAAGPIRSTGWPNIYRTKLTVRRNPTTAGLARLRIRTLVETSTSERARSYPAQVTVEEVYCRQLEKLAIGKVGHGIELDILSGAASFIRTELRS